MAPGPGRPALPVALSRATSRTRTGRHPLSPVTVWRVTGQGDIRMLYAGPVQIPAMAPILPGSVAYPFTAEAVQVMAWAGSGDAIVVVMLDLGAEYDVARIELYGNLLLPPEEANGRPLYNFGVPRRVVVAVAEEATPYTDLHRQTWQHEWLGQSGFALGSRYETGDLRALWGWTPIHLPPTYGRYLTLVFTDLPLVLHDSRTGPSPESTCSGSWSTPTSTTPITGRPSNTRRSRRAATVRGPIALLGVSRGEPRPAAPPVGVPRTVAERGAAAVRAGRAAPRARRGRAGPVLLQRCRRPGR